MLKQRRKETLLHREPSVWVQYAILSNSKQVIWRKHKIVLKGLFFSWVNSKIPISTHFNPHQPTSTILTKFNLSHKKKFNPLQPTLTHFNLLHSFTHPIYLQKEQTQSLGFKPNHFQPISFWTDENIKWRTRSSVTTIRTQNLNSTQKLAQCEDHIPIFNSTSSGLMTSTFETKILDLKLKTSREKTKDLTLEN